MQVTREDLNPCTVKLTIVCDPDEVRVGYETAFRQITKKIKLPGFRPGKAPKAMLESVVPQEEWNEAAAEEIVRKSYKNAIEQEALEVDRSTPPTVSVEKLDMAENAAEFTMKVPLPPKVELGEYKGLPVEQPATQVTDEEVDFQLTELRKRGQTRESVTDRGAQESDVAVVNIKVDGEEGEGRNFMTIIGQTFPQLDAALTGMQLEEMKGLELEFPETFQEKDWAGQTKHAQISLNSLSTVRLPELDDEFAQSMRTENVEDLRNRIREALGQAKQLQAREIVHERLLEALMERSEVAVSDNMWEGLADRRLRETAEEQNRQKKSLEQYAAENGMTVEQLVQAWRDRAKIEVERALLIQSVFSKEQMGITNAELNGELAEMAREYETDPENMIRILSENKALDELQFRALSRKVGNFLLANAEVKVAEPASV